LQRGHLLQNIVKKLLIRHFAAECDPLQIRPKQTQNPPRATSWGFDPPPGTKLSPD
jgi:hypothetical protein